MQAVGYQPAARSAKPEMAVLSGPTRRFAGWALVKTGKLSRPTKRFVVIRSSRFFICATENITSAILTLPISSASMHIDRSHRLECHVRLGSYRIWMQMLSETELRVCKQAFEFANRDMANYYKLVTHRQLGKGRSSEVVFAFDVSSGDHSAIKVMNKDKATSTERDFAEKEVTIRMTLQHPCIVQTIDIFETQYDLFVVMELMGGGSLDRRLVKQNAPLSEVEARVIMRRLYAALSHLHARGIAHRNVKPQNLFLDISDDLRWCETVKLSDFSLACFLDDPACSRQIVGTPEYLAPEATFMTRTALGERGLAFGTEVDMWAAGVTLYNLLTLELPFEGEYPPDVFKRSRSANIPFSESAFRHVSPEAISLIKSLLNVDRRKRPTADTVLLHPWFTNNEPTPEHDLGCEMATLVLTSKFRTVTESLFRFRTAVLAVRMIHRLVLKTPGLRLQTTRVEKRFHFNVSGINIAPIPSSYEGKKHRPDDPLPQRNSATVMSRISTSSSVKSRSSMGDSVTSPVYSFIPMPTSPHHRSDRNQDYITNSNSRPTRQSSIASGGRNSVHRLITDAVGQIGSGANSHLDTTGQYSRTTWRWRKRSITKDGLPPTGALQ